MDQKEYLDNLRSPDVNKRRLAFASDYRPRTTKELQVALDAALIAKPDLQVKLLEHLKEMSIDISLPAYLKLTMCAHTPLVRIGALRQLEASFKPEIVQTLFTAAFDRNYAVEEAAIDALGKRSRTNEITELLLTRISDPAAEIDEKEKGLEVIKRAAIRNLGADGVEEVIVPLAKIALLEPGYRSEVQTSLSSVYTPGVARILMDIIESVPRLDMFEGAAPQPTVDEAFEMFAAPIILTVPLSQDLLDRVRPFYCRVYVREIVRQKTFLSDHLADIFSPAIGQCLVQLLSQHVGNPEIVGRLIEDLAMVPLRLGFPYWLECLDRPELVVFQACYATLRPLIQADVVEFLHLLSESILSGHRVAHDVNRMPEILKSLPEQFTTFSDSIVQLIRLPDDIATEVAMAYLDTLWQATPQEAFQSLLESLIKYGYLKNPDSQVAVSQFLKKSWDRNPEARSITYHYLTGLCVKPKITRTIGQLLVSLVQTIESPGSLITLIVNDLNLLIAQDRMWPILSEVLQFAAPEIVWEHISAAVKASWNRDLMELLYARDPQNIGELCRIILSDPERYPVIDQDRVWLINILGDLAQPHDQAFFASFISLDFPSATQIAGIKALAKQPDLAAVTTILTTALKNPDAAIVDEAISKLALIGVPSNELVQALQERTYPDYEPNASIRANAVNALQAITARHLAMPPDRTTDEPRFYTWLEVVRQIGICDCESILNDLLIQHSHPEAVNRRIAVVQTISRAANPDQGIQILESAMERERERSVRDAMRDALDELERHPDRADFSLINQVIGRPALERGALLGKWHLDELFVEQRTIVGFRQGLRDAIDVSKNNSSFVAQLDAISDALIRDIYKADKARLDPDGKIPDDDHESHIKKLKKFYPDMSLAASGLHDLRNLKAKGPHLYDPSGQLRQGVSDIERQRAEDQFASLVEEVIKVLRKIKEASP